MTAQDQSAAEAEKLRRDAEYKRFLEALGARIRALRKQRGWSWRDMVVLHDFHLSKWQSYESGRYGISLPSLLRISKLFGLTLSELVLDLEQEATVLDKAVPAKGSSLPPPATTMSRKSQGAKPKA